MKRILWIMVIAATALMGQYSPYSGEWTEGDQKYCKYLDGTIITVPYYASCPMSVD